MQGNLNLKSELPKFDLVEINGKRFHRLLEDWSFNGQTIKAGFIFDGQTIPFFLRWIFGGVGEPEVLPEACLHDWLYKEMTVSRYYADVIFRNQLKKRQRWRAYPYFFGLRLYCFFKYSEWKDLIK